MWTPSGSPITHLSEEVTCSWGCPPATSTDCDASGQPLGLQLWSSFGHLVDPIMGQRVREQPKGEKQRLGSMSHTFWLGFGAPSPDGMAGLHSSQVPQEDLRQFQERHSRAQEVPERWHLGWRPWSKDGTFSYSSLCVRWGKNCTYFLGLLWISHEIMKPFRSLV